MVKKLKMNIASIFESPLSSSSLLSHDKSAAIITNDDTFAYEEAKLSGVKNDGYALSPEKSLFAGFKQLNINFDDIDYWVFPRDKNLSNQKKNIKSYFKYVHGKYDPRLLSNLINKKTYFIPHHDGHLALAGFSSPYDESVVLSIDGGGDWGDHYHLVLSQFTQKNKFPISKRSIQLRGSYGLANFHSWLTEGIGFLDDGKTSGLASYGKLNNQLYLKLLQLFIRDRNNMLIFKKKRNPFYLYKNEKINLDSYQRKKIIYNQPGITNLSKLIREYRVEDIAFTGTKIIKDEILNILKKTKSIYPKEKNISFAGGLFNNVNINNFIIKSGIFQNYHFTMAPGDAGISLGAGLMLHHIKSFNRKKVYKKKKMSPYLGPSFDTKEIIEILKTSNLKFKILSKKKLSKTIAKFISKGKVVGLFLGRGEFGPRSLGHRSIIASPKIKNIKEIINSRLKKRDWFMPFAPAVLDEDFFKITNSEYQCPYMQVAYDCKKNAENFIFSGVHVDRTARIQVVNKNFSKDFYEIILEFKKISGIPAVLNTSFNRHGIATIGTPRQAIEHLLFGTCDALFVNNILIETSQNLKNLGKKVKKVEEETKLLKKTNDIFRKKINEVFQQKKTRKYNQ